MRPDDHMLTEDIHRGMGAFLAQSAARKTPDDDARALRLLQARLGAQGLSGCQLDELVQWAQYLAQYNELL